MSLQAKGWGSERATVRKREPDDYRYPELALVCCDHIKSAELDISVSSPPTGPEPFVPGEIIFGDARLQVSFNLLSKVISH